MYETIDPQKAFRDAFNRDIPLSSTERETQKENMLQLGWFAHRCQNIQSQGKLEEALARIALSDAEMAERIARTKADEEKQTILLETMITSPEGSSEAAWFRLHFPNDKSKPLAPEYAVILSTFSSDGDPTKAFQELDQLYKESLIVH